MMMRLHVNVDHCATLREARGTRYPDPVWAASLAELAGAHGITAHLREDRRHVQDRDIRLLKQSVGGVFNLEMAATDEMVAVALEIRPHLVTLVPERREERTTEGGLELSDARLATCIERLRGAGIQVSLFVAPEVSIVAEAAELQSQLVELHTGAYCEASGNDREREILRLREAAKEAKRCGLRCAAGHGLNYNNVLPVVGIDEIEELNIGHAVIAQAVLVGIDRAVRDMLALLQR